MILFLSTAVLKKTLVSKRQHLKIGSEMGVIQPLRKKKVLTMADE